MSLCHSDCSVCCFHSYENWQIVRAGHLYKKAIHFVWLAQLLVDPLVYVVGQKYIQINKQIEHNILLKMSGAPNH